jgi:protein-tyrosine phosphatase
MPVQRDPQVLEDMVHRGLLIQVTAASALGLNGREAEETARILLRHHWVHFIASDAHSPRMRRPRLAEAAELLRELIGERETNELVLTNGERLLHGEAIPTDPSSYKVQRHRSFFSRLFHIGSTRE